MQKFTMKEALEMVDDYELDTIAPFIYAYEDGDIIFYIGISYEPFQRLQQHIGKGAYFVPPDPIGNLILENLPQSLQWTVSIHTLQELVPNRYARVTNSNGYKWLAEDLESTLIAKLHPCLNRKHNQSPTRLPEKYWGKPTIVAEDSSSMYLDL